MLGEHAADGVTIAKIDLAEGRAHGSAPAGREVVQNDDGHTAVL